MSDTTDTDAPDPDVATDGGADPAEDTSTTAGGTDRTNVAIACQGGGSHTAFTAGVLQTLLKEVDWEEECNLVGISGTSGGAFNALAAWYGLVTEGPERSVELLEELWDALSAKGTADRAANSWVTALNRLEKSGFPFPQVSPYDIPGDELGKERIRDALEGCIDFETIPPLCGRESPELVVGTVDVNGGVFETFTNEDVTVDAVLASAAVPDLFEAVELHGHGRLHVREQRLHRVDRREVDLRRFDECVTTGQHRQRVGGLVCAGCPDSVERPEGREINSHVRSN